MIIVKSDIVMCEDVEEEKCERCRRCPTVTKLLARCNSFTVQRMSDHRVLMVQKTRSPFSPFTIDSQDGTIVIGDERGFRTQLMRSRRMYISM